jgi:Reverse transcriptase (RNA-dependent DNA polymerase)
LTSPHFDLRRSFVRIKALLPSILLVCKASYTLRYLPIPKAGTKDPEQPKSFRPISLTSFLLKNIEKLIDLHRRSKYLVKHPLHKTQFAYQTGKSTVSTLNHLVAKIEKALRYKEVALSAFADIQGAFDNTGF